MQYIKTQDYFLMELIKFKINTEEAQLISSNVIPTDGDSPPAPIIVRNLPTNSVSLFGLRATVIQPIVPIEVKRMKH